MAKMTAEQVTKELERKASLGIAPTNKANQTQYDSLVKNTNTAPAWLGLNPDGSLKSGGKTPETSEKLNPNQTIQPYNAGNDINQLAEMQRKQAMASLQKSRDNALGNLSQEKETIAPVFYDKRNQANVQMNNSDRSFSEFMAQRGLQSSGVGAQGQLMNNMTYQSNIGNLNTAESNAFADIAKRQTDVSNNYESDLVSAESGIEASKLQNLIAEYQRQDQLKRQDTATAKAEEEAAFQKQIGTLGQYGDNYALEIQQRTAANPNDPYIPYLKMLRQQKVSGMATSQAEAEQQAFLNSIKSGELGLKQAGYNLDALKTNYDISKPYYNPNGGSNGSGGSDKTTVDEVVSHYYNQLDGKPVKDVKAWLNTNASSVIGEYGINAYNKLWNTVLANSIAEGNTTKK